MAWLRRPVLPVLILFLFHRSLLWAEEPRVRIGFFPNLTHAQALYARATGSFDKALGQPVRWIKFNAGPTIVESMFKDELDLAYLGPSPTINGYSKSRGQKFVIVSGAASGGAGLVVREGSGIRGESDFHHKTIATPQLGNSQDVSARIWFLERNYQFKDRGGTLTLIPLSNPDQLTMFRKKQIDGAWTIEPWLSRLELEGGGRIFLEEKKIWPGGRFVVTQVIARREFLARHPEQVEKILEAHIEITELLNREKEKTAGVLNAQLEIDAGKPLSDPVLMQALSRLEFTWDPIRSSLGQTAENLHRVGFARTRPSLDGIYSLDLLNRVLERRKLPPLSTPK